MGNDLFLPSVHEIWGKVMFSQVLSLHGWGLPWEGGGLHADPPPPPRRQTPRQKADIHTPRSQTANTVNTWLVRILLECILVRS